MRIMKKKRELYHEYEMNPSSIVAISKKIVCKVSNTLSELKIVHS